jgi:MFS family permease
MFGSALASSLPELLAYRFVAGAGSAAYASGASATLADLSTSKNRGRVLGANQAAALAGAALGPALGGAIVSVTALAQKNAPSFFLAQEMGDVATRAPFFAVGLGCLFAAFHAFRVAPETLVLERGTMTKASARSSTRGVEERSEKTADDDVSRGGDAATGLKDVAKRRVTTKHSAFDSTLTKTLPRGKKKKKKKPSACVARVATSSPPPASTRLFSFPGRADARRSCLCWPPPCTAWTSRRSARCSRRWR